MAHARELRQEVTEARKSTFLEILEAVVIALILAFAIRTFAVQAFKIPSGSMIPALLVGDHILVNKFIFGTRVPFVEDRFLTIREPHRGDVLARQPHHDLSYPAGVFDVRTEDGDLHSR